MSTFDYGAVLETARTLIAEFGRNVQAATLATTAGASGKPWDGTQALTPPATSPQALTPLATLPAVFVDPSSARSLGLTAGPDDPLLKRFQQFAILAPQAGTPDLRNANVLVDNGVRWVVGYTSVLAPAETTLLYFFGVNQ